MLLTGLAVALARWRRDNGQDQTFAHIELEGHGREGRFVPLDPDLSRTVGWFTTLFPVTVDPGSDDLASALKRVKEDLALVPSNGAVDVVIDLSGDPGDAAPTYRVVSQSKLATLVVDLPPAKAQ